MAAHSLEPGHRIGAADVRVAEVGSIEGLSTVAERDKTSVIGKTVTTHVDSGTLLNPSSVRAQLTPGVGSSVIGVAVKAGQYPALGLKAGDPVHVVVTATGQNTGTTTAAKPGTAWSGSVTSVSDVNRDGIRTVDVTLPADQAVQAATASGTGGLALVLDASQGR